MIYLLIATLCTVSLNVFFKLSENKKNNRYAVTFFNGVSALFVSWLFVWGQRLFDPGWFAAMSAEFPSVAAGGGKFGAAGSAGFAILIAVGAGLVSYAAYILLQLSTARNGTAMTISFNKVGVMIPAILSVVFFHEEPRLMQIVGVAVAMVAIFMVYFKKGETSAVTLPVALFGTMFVGGFCDFVSKIFEVFGRQEHQGLFVFYLYIFSTIIALAVMLLNKAPITKSAILFGLVTGVPAQFITQFLLRALTTVPAFVVFPLYSVGAILMVNLINYFFFHEKLTRLQFIAIGLMIISTALLNL